MNHKCHMRLLAVSSSVRNCPQAMEPYSCSLPLLLGLSLLEIAFCLFYTKTRTTEFSVNTYDLLFSFVPNYPNGYLVRARHYGAWSCYI